MKKKKYNNNNNKTGVNAMQPLPSLVGKNMLSRYAVNIPNDKTLRR